MRESARVRCTAPFSQSHQGRTLIGKLLHVHLAVHGLDRQVGKCGFLFNELPMHVEPRFDQIGMGHKRLSVEQLSLSAAIKTRT